MPVWKIVSQSTKIGDKIDDLFVAEITERKKISDIINYNSAIKHNAHCIEPVTFMYQHPKDPRPPVQLTGPINLPKINTCLYARLINAQLTFSF